MDLQLIVEHNSDDDELEAGELIEEDDEDESGLDKPGGEEPMATDVGGEEEEDDDSSHSDSETELDSDYDFIDNMLEENVDDESLKQPSLKRKFDNIENTKRHEIRKRTILIKRDQDHFEILPEGWIEITHFSGMPVYLHKESRVCSMSKPYYLGSGSARKHEIPVSAIPCLQYKRDLEKERKKKEETLRESGLAPIAKVQTLEESKREKSLDFVAVREYCGNLFEFKTVTIQKFKTWAERRKHAQMKKLAQRPSLPESTKLITCTIPKNASSTLGKAVKKEFIMNPAGKSDVCILHEYVQHTGRTQPKYVFQELENVSKPYCATVIINDMEYGKGYGSSKKEAKTEAARATLDILIPNLNNSSKEEKTDLPNDLSFFDNIDIDSDRVRELCEKAGQFSPYQILVECLRRHQGIGDMDIKTEVKMSKHQKNEFTMTVGEKCATVRCKNKREGKQLAAQAILKALHPNLKSWGAILKLYGRGSCKTPKEKKEEAQQITELQNTACSNKPNYAILNKLREEMLKLKSKPEPLNLNVVPINIQISSDDK